MAEPKGHPCPECGTPREPDNSPACACAQRASDALRDARTAQAAAAEDFDPLRIRPYVELDGPARQAPAETPTRELPTVGRQTPPGGPTTPLRAVPPRVAGGAPEAFGAAPGAGDAPGPSAASAPAHTPGAASAVPGAGEAPGAPSLAPGAPSPAPGAGPAAPHAVDQTSVLPTPLAPPSSAPSDTDLRLFEAPEAAGAGPATGEGHGDGDGPRSRRRRRGVLLSAAGGVVAVVAAAGYASGLFSYETPSRDSALPSDLRASVPDAPAGTVSATASGQASPSASRTSASPSPSVSESASPSPSPSRSSASPSPSEKPAVPSAPAPTVTADGTLSSGPDDDGRDDGRDDGTVLRRGDRGPEVTELQLRLRRLYLYTGEAHGRFTHQVEDALRTYQWSRGVDTGEGELGVYGPDTRRSLESETREP
ncbi:peptidoglycan-binding protein [Streptomyces sp. DH24]|uniref:peptidoglycan-binding protein n=1 Tax=Streptomyces sp. DH24 TaxID=3040123 RepID=UPI002441E71F|nr:peptidoglycan-binding protein [Streptomyces sp. DH24]MDG9717176.1 peptidoglycan-binding protein [Streptomyces sp. DH24]